MSTPYHNTEPVAIKDHTTNVHEMFFDHMLQRQPDKTWKVMQSEIDYWEFTEAEVQQIEARANDNFIIRKGEKYHRQDGISEDGPYTFKCPLDIYAIINKYDLWPED